MVPGSTFKYGSSFLILTLYPLDCNKYANDADDNPLPKDETTPPVTNIYRAMEVCYTSLIINYKDLIILIGVFVEGLNFPLPLFLKLIVFHEIRLLK